MSLHGCIISTFNCKGFKSRNCNYLQQLFREVDFLLLQELWLYDYEFDNITKELNDSCYIAKSNMFSDKLRDGRPYGGTAIVWKRNSPYHVTRVDTVSDRLCACKVEIQDVNFILIDVYMPTNMAANNDLFVEIFYEIVSMSLMYESYNIILAGDFNCNLSNCDFRTDIFKEFLNLMELDCPTTESSHNILYTFINSQNHTSLIDHFCISSDISSKIDKLYILDEGDNLSDHLPLILELNIDVNDVPSQINSASSRLNKFKICWEDATEEQINNYKSILSEQISKLIDSNNYFECSNLNCDNPSHFHKFYNLLLELIESIKLSSFACIPIKYFNEGKVKSKFMVGWNKYIEKYRNRAVFWHNIWKNCDRPIEGYVASIRKSTRKEYHSAINKVKSHDNIILRDEIASSLHNNNPKIFWEKINRLASNKRTNPKDIDGKVELDACNVFKERYKKLYNESPDDDLKYFLNTVNDSINERCLGNNTLNHLHVIEPYMVKNAIGRLNKGKSDTVDMLCTNSFINAPNILYIILSRLFSVS